MKLLGRRTKRVRIGAGEMILGQVDVERRGTYNPLQRPPSGILPVTPPVAEYYAFPHTLKGKHRQRRVYNFPDGASAYLFPGAYDPMVRYEGQKHVRNTRQVNRTVCKEIWEY